jgi:predicted nuclease with TOPRIM domain
MLHWDDELERRMAPLRAKVEAENRKIAELQSKLFHAEMEALRLGWYLRRMEEENRRLQEMLRAALGQAWGGEGLDEVKEILEQAWLELVLIASPKAEPLGALIRSLEALKVWQSPR